MTSSAVDGSQPAEEVTWVEVATALGTPNAIIIAGRLESAGISTHVQQEAAGVHAFPVNVGLLGTAYVLVPEKDAERARHVLAVEFDEEE